jgi:hypothetical protein
LAEAFVCQARGIVLWAFGVEIAWVAFDCIPARASAGSEAVALTTALWVFEGAVFMDALLAPAVPERCTRILTFQYWLFLLLLLLLIRAVNELIWVAIRGSLAPFFARCQSFLCSLLTLLLAFTTRAFVALMSVHAEEIKRRLC